MWRRQEFPIRNRTCLNLVFGDTHAAYEKRIPAELDWWACHSRRGWEDNTTGWWDVACDINCQPMKPASLGAHRQPQVGHGLWPAGRETGVALAAVR